MNITVRISRGFHASLVEDLERPHAFAYERVGWIFAKQAEAMSSHLLLLPVAYEPVDDDNYIADPAVGACFNATAIRAALQRCRSKGLSCLQVHLHNHRGETDFSGVDCQTIDELAPPFRSVAPGLAHGGLVLSRDSATVRIWLPGSLKPARSRVVIVGFPMHFAQETYAARAL